MKKINMKFLALSLMVVGGSVFMHNALATEGLNDDIQKLGAAHIKAENIKQLSGESRALLHKVFQQSKSELKSKLKGLAKSDRKIVNDLKKEVLYAEKHFPELFKNETATAAIGTENISNDVVNQENIGQENDNINVSENEQSDIVATVESVPSLNEVAPSLNEINELAVQSNDAIAIETIGEQAVEETQETEVQEAETQEIKMQEAEVAEEKDNNVSLSNEDTEVQETEVTQEKEERPQTQAKAVQMANVSVQNTNMDLTEVPYFVKIYKNNVDNYQYFIKNNMNDKDGFSFKFSVNATTGKSIINNNTTYDSKSPEVAFGIQNKLNDNFKVSFDTMYKEQKYDLDSFKDVKDKMLFVSANAEGTTKIADLNAGYIFSNKLNSDINKSGNGLVGKLDNTNHRFFATIGKKFELYDNLYLSTNAGANFDIIGMKNFKVHDNLGNSTEIKDKNHFLTTETLDIMLNKEMLLNKMKLNLFAGVNFNHTNKTINMSDKDGDAIAKFKVKTHNYFVGGIDFKLNDTFGLKTTYKNNLSKSKDNQVNLGINMNI